MKKIYADLIKEVHRTLPIVYELNVHTIVKKDSEKSQIKIYLERYLFERSLNTLMSIYL